MIHTQFHTCKCYILSTGVLIFSKENFGQEYFGKSFTIYQIVKVISLQNFVSCGMFNHVIISFTVIKHVRIDCTKTASYM